MMQMKTIEEARDLVPTLRADVAQTPALSRVTVLQAVDNPVNSQDPYGPSVQVRGGHTGLVGYVLSWEHWQTEFKPELMRVTAAYERLRRR